nr:MAG TPA: hypothetical protein [Caudoviricetes sp.]
MCTISAFAKYRRRNAANGKGRVEHGVALQGNGNAQIRVVKAKQS